MKATRNNPRLWMLCKKAALSKFGKHSARAMQYAVKLYKQNGGGYVGSRNEQNSLVKFSNKKQNGTTI
jgi:hypothetical protein